MKSLLEDDNVPATILNILLVKEFGAQYYNWELETIWYELQQTTKLPFLSQFIKDKIGAIVALNTSEVFYNTWECFENICEAFNDQIVDFEDLTPLTTEKLVWGIMESRLNDETPNSFGLDVKAYIETVFKVTGISTCPKYIEPFIGYKTYNKYNEQIETIYQKRIEIYCLDRLNRIIELCQINFDFNLFPDIKKEFPHINFQT